MPVWQPAAAFQGAAIVLGAVAQGVANVAEVEANVEEVVERERVRMDEILANDAEVHLRGEVDRILLDPTDGVLQLQGTRAIDASVAYQDRVRRAAARLEVGLKTEDQKATFRLRVQAMEQDAERRVMVHVGNVTEQLDLDGYDVLSRALANAAADAGREWGTEDATKRANDAVTRLGEETVRFWDRRGVEPDVRDQRVAEAVSLARARQIEAVAESGRAGTASDLLTEFGDDLQEDHRKSVTDTVRRLQHGQGVTATAFRILAEAKGDRAAQEAAIDAEPEGTRADVRKVVRGENDADDNLAKDNREAAFERTVQWMEDNPGKDPRLGVGADYDLLSLHQRNDVDRRWKGPVDEADNDDAAYLGLLLMAPGDVAKLTLSEYSAIRTRLSPSYQVRADAIVTRHRKDPTGTSAESAGIFSATARLARTFEAVFGQDATSKNPVIAKRFTAFATAVDSASLAITGRGEKLGDTELQKIMTETALRQQAEALRPARAGGGTFLRPRAGGTIPFRQIPVAVRDSITFALQQRGRAFPATQEVVEQAYTARLRGDFATFDRLLGRTPATLALPDITNPFGFVKPTPP